MRILALILFIYIAFGIRFSFAQTCCSGGVPVSSNLGFKGSDEGVLQIALVSDFNILKTLKSGREILNDDSRKRTTQSYIIRPALTLSKRWSIEGFIPFVRQTRNIESSTGSTDFESSFGIGDPIFLGVFSIISKPINFRIGAGPKIPIGSFSHRNDRGILLLEDMQPGSGAWDAITMLMIDYNWPTRPSLNLFTNIIQSFKGTNERSRGGFQSYRFGNDIQLISGFADNLLINNMLISTGLSLRYRHANNDEVSGSELPATGGDFLFARANLGFNLSKKLGDINMNFELPIYADVTDTQLVPSYRFNLSWTFKFQLRQESINKKIILNEN